MTNIREVLAVSKMLLISIFSLIFFIKLVLYFKYEKEWDSITFFHFTKIQLKMTVSKELRKMRKRQNTLSTLMLILVLCFAAVASFNLLIKD
jgi:cytochrome b561